MAVEQFRGEHFFLSNMYRLEHGVETEHGIVVPTSEHAYQANRFVNETDHKAVTLADDGIKAKNLARGLLDRGAPQKEDWDFIKPAVMYGIVTQKFVRNPDLAAKLLATGEEELWEGNTWDDRYWGVCPPGSRDGQNHLGRILMRVRFELSAVAQANVMSESSAVQVAETSM